MTAINLLLSIGVLMWGFTVLFSRPGEIESELTKDPGNELFIRSFFPSVDAFWFLFVFACWPMLVVELLRHYCPAWFGRMDDSEE